MTELIPQPTRKPRPKLKQPPGMRLSGKMRNAIAAIIDGSAKTQAAAGRLCGVSASQISRIMNRPEMEAFLASERARNLKLATVRASKRIHELVDHESGHVSFRATEALLQTSGDLKMANGPSIHVSNQVIGSAVIAPGYIVNLDPDSASQAFPATVIDGATAGQEPDLIDVSGSRACDGVTRGEPK